MAEPPVFHSLSNPASDNSSQNLVVLDVLAGADMLPADFRFVKAGPQAAPLFGIIPRRLTGRTVSDLFDTTEFDALFTACRITAQSGQAQSVLVTSPGFDGVLHPYTIRIGSAREQVFLHVTNEPEPDAAPLLVPGDVLNTLSDSLCLLDPVGDDATGTTRPVDFTYRFVNHAFSALWSPTTGDLRGQLFSDSVIHSIQPRLLDQLRSVVESGEVYEDDFFIDNGSPAGWYTVRISPTETGSLVMTLRNCSAIRHMLQQTEDQNLSLQEAITNLERSNYDLAQFAQVASHDLQEPLRKIQVFSDLLQNQLRDSLSEGERDLSRRLQLAAQRMQHMIRDLMNYSRLASDKASFVAVDLNAVLPEVLADLDMLVTDRQAQIDVTALPTVTGNESRLRQLFQNLIANALKFQPANQTPIVQIDSQLADNYSLPASLVAQPQRRYYRITVTDNGIGFDVEKYRSKLFRLFQRLHERKAYEGTGIGLAVAQRVAESHGGLVDVRSTPGVGSTFEIYLPA